MRESRLSGSVEGVLSNHDSYSDYSVSQLEMLLKDCNFLDLIERPGLWRSGLRWVVAPGMQPEAAV